MNIFSASSLFAFGLVLSAGLFWYWKTYVAGKKSSGVRHSGKTAELDHYSKDFTTMAREKKLDPVIGREEEIKRVIHVLSRRTKNNPILIGETGVGKTSIVEGLAIKIVQKSVPPSLQNKRVLALDLNSLLSDTKYRGEFESRLKRVTDEIIASRRSIILFIDEVHIIARNSGDSEGGSLGVSDILKPALARGELQMIGATTFAEYVKYIKQDATLERRFHPIVVDEPNIKLAAEMVKGIKKEYEDHHQVMIEDSAIEMAVALSDKMLKHRFLPDKAIDLIDEACAKVRMEYQGSATKRPKVTSVVVREILKEWKSFYEKVD